MHYVYFQYHQGQKRYFIGFLFYFLFRLQGFWGTRNMLSFTFFSLLKMVGKILLLIFMYFLFSFLKKNFDFALVLLILIFNLFFCIFVGNILILISVSHTLYPYRYTQIKISENIVIWSCIYQHIQLNAFF